MTDAYIYQAALLCPLCVADMGFTLHQCESSEDSDAIPAGPYANGGGEADGPQHCDHCLTFLDNPLTPDGEDYVREQVRRNGDHTGNLVVAEWRGAYSYLFQEDDQ
jgi:hypothetical protein